MTPPLPVVLTTTVVRSVHKGSSHGGAHLVDLATGDIRQVLDWNDGSIDWSGRGGDRGLRGIAYHGEAIVIAASDEIFLFDRDFRRLRSIRNPYLKLCHEIAVADGRLYLTSTGFDSILVYDLADERFLAGYCLRLDANGRIGFRVYNPEQADGPPPQDSTHINSVHVEADRIFVGGHGLGRLVAIRHGEAGAYARLPLRTHNARPFRGGVLANFTGSDCLAWFDIDGRVRQSIPVPRYAPAQLTHTDLPADIARPAFARGLALIDENLVVGGSSPATLAVYRLEPPALLKTVTLSLDVRNAIHGLALWPFANRRLAAHTL
jgi:hypothetical protein